MMSIENFYWILYQNMLGPVGLDCWYHTPFGTNHKLNKHEYRPRISRKNDHVMFYHDQEPIWTENFGPYDLEEGAWKSIACRLLANSEISDIKKQICKHRGMLDWYFFYHGFAALDWFRDTEYIDDVEDISRRFCSLNHLISGQRCYRIALTAQLAQMDLLGFGDISFHANKQDCIDEVCNPDSLLSSCQKESVNNFLASQSKLPLRLDNDHCDGNSSAHFGHKEYKLWQRSQWHVVNETVYFEPKLHLTEKIFKPIVASRPFILVGAPGNLAYLRSYGFESFGEWIDETYDAEPDPVVRLGMIAEEIRKICAKTADESRKIHAQMDDILVHNKTHFFGRFKEIIVNELVENFETCIRIWNNGRIDDRMLPSLSDRNTIKQILLR